MKTIINFLGKISGISKLWTALDGYKTKIGGTALFLSGLAGILSTIAGMTFDTASIIALVKSMSSDPSFIIMMNGLGILGIGHKIEKSEAK